MLSTAAELWEEWKLKGAVRPNGYDRDVADFLRAELARQGHTTHGTLVTAMNAAGWNARDLLRALAPVVASFSGMQRDLLRLLDRIGASSGDGEDLRVEYEFEEGDVLDDTLAAFREKVHRTERFVTRVQPWHFDDACTAWKYPLNNFASHKWINDVVARAGHTEWRDWEFERGIPDPKPTGDARVDGLARDILALARFALGRLLEVGTSLSDIYGLAPDVGDVEGPIAERRTTWSHLPGGDRQVAAVDRVGGARMVREGHGRFADPGGLRLPGN